MRERDHNMQQPPICFRRRFHPWLAVAVVAITQEKIASGEAPLAPVVKQRPNVILLISDDQGWQEVGYMTPGIHTPTLDEMAANGMRFDRFYAGHSRCSPTRSCIMTGRQALRTGVRSPGRFIGPGMYRDEHTIAQLFKEAGYATGHFGKWHLGSGEGYEPCDRGYEEAAWIGNHYNDGVGFKKDPEGTHVKTTGDCSEATVKVAIEFIDRSAVAERPFFCTVWFGSPHAPYTSSLQHRKLYPDSPSPEYLAEITGIDTAIGILRKRLQELGVQTNTQLWFCSDNGPTAQKGVLLCGPKGPIKPLIRGSKKGVAEGGIRVPGVLEWPAMIKEPRVISVPISGLDFYPTFVAMLGVTPKAVGPLDGEDVMPILKGEADDREKALRFYVSETYPGEEVKKPKPPTSALVEKRFKLSNTQGRLALYDLIADPMETRNVADQHPELFQRMRAELVVFHESLTRCARRAVD